jgi:tetratricopeptide (TPR) repeat protein
MFQKGMRLNPFAPAWYYSGFGGALCDVGRYEESVSAYKKALQLAPDSIMANWGLALTYTYAGRPEEAIPLYQKTIQLSPLTFFFYADFGGALRDAGRLEEAVSAFKKAIQLAPDEIVNHIGLASTYSIMRREKEGRAEVEEVMRINPKFSLDSYAKRIPYKDQSQTDKLINALRTAGLK